MNSNRVLITGGAGFIRSNLANHLASNNKMVAVDDLCLGNSDNLADGVKLVERSVLDDGNPTDVDVVFHLAALSSRNMHEEHPSLANSETA